MTVTDADEKISRLTTAALALAWVGMLAPYLLQIALRSGRVVVSSGVVSLAFEIAYWSSYAALTLTARSAWKRPGIANSITIAVALLGIYTYLTANVSVHHPGGG